MKRILASAILLMTSTGFADSSAYFNVGDASKPQPFQCEVYLENGEEIKGLIVTTGEARDAFEKIISKKSTRDTKVVLGVNEDNSSNLVFTENTLSTDKTPIKRIKILDRSFCKLVD